MRIGIDATPWSNRRGFGRFTRSLVRALVACDRGNEHVLFFDRGYERCDGVPPAATHVVVSTSVGLDAALAPDRHRPVADLWRMARAVARANLDVFFCPSIDSYYAVLGAARRVVMVHDAIPERRGAAMLPSTAARLRRRIKVRVALAQARRIVTGSEYVRRDVARTFGLDAARIGVIPYAADSIFRPPADLTTVVRHVSAAHGLDRHYLLHVGGFGPNKNLPRLVEAFSRASTDALLVFVGDRGPDARYSVHAALDEAVARHELDGRVRFLGYLPDEVLVPLYQAAAAVAVPSLEEGYGLPGIEAVACGTPVIATTESPLPEALGGACLRVDPHDTGALSGAIGRLLADAGEAARYRSEARARADRFRWETSAREALNVFRETAGLGPDST